MPKGKKKKKEAKESKYIESESEGSENEAKGEDITKEDLEESDEEELRTAIEPIIPKELGTKRIRKKTERFQPDAKTVEKVTLKVEKQEKEEAKAVDKLDAIVAKYQALRKAAAQAKVAKYKQDRAAKLEAEHIKAMAKEEAGYEETIEEETEEQTEKYVAEHEAEEVAKVKAYKAKKEAQKIPKAPKPPKPSFNEPAKTVFPKREVKAAENAPGVTKRTKPRTKRITEKEEEDEIYVGPVGAKEKAKAVSIAEGVETHKKTVARHEKAKQFSEAYREPREFEGVKEEERKLLRKMKAEKYAKEHREPREFESVKEEERKLLAEMKRETANNNHVAIPEEAEAPEAAPEPAAKKCNDPAKPVHVKMKSGKEYCRAKPGPRKGAEGKVGGTRVRHNKAGWSDIVTALSGGQAPPKSWTIPTLISYIKYYDKYQRKPKNRADFTHYLKTGHRKHGARRSAGKSKLYEQKRKKQ
jgi:hypothetical protein